MLHTRRCQCWRYVTANCFSFTNLHILLPLSLSFSLSLFLIHIRFNFEFELILSQMKFLKKKRTQIRKLQTFLKKPSVKYFVYFLYAPDMKSLWLYVYTIVEAWKFLPPNLLLCSSKALFFHQLHTLIYFISKFNKCWL